MKYLFSLIFIALIFSQQIMAQDKPISEMTREEVLSMTYDELVELPLEDLMELANIVGVSLDELYEMLLNPELSIASKREENTFKSPLSTSVVTKEEIEASGATSLQELFRIVPGVIVREKTNGNFDLHIRGNDNVPPGNFSHFTENMLTLVMIDSRIVYNYVNGGTFWESLPISLNDIEQIEVIRGPSSALYGPNAVSGVINIVTKKPAGSKLTFEGDIQYGNDNQLISSASFRKKFDNGFGFNAYLNYETRDRGQNDYYCYALEKYVKKDHIISIFGAPYGTYGVPDENLSKQRQAGNLALTYNPIDNVDIELTFGTQNSEIQTVFFENLATPLSNRETESTYLNFNSKIFGLSAQVSYINGRQNLSVAMMKPVVEYDMSTLNANLEYEFKFDNLSIRPGFNYQKSIYDDSKYVTQAQKEDPLRQGLLNGKNSLSSYALSLRADYLVFEKLRLIAALRTDKYDKPDDNYFSYQFISTYCINDKTLLRAVYSKANRGSFIGNVYADFKNTLGEQPIMLPGVPQPINFMYYQYYIGNENMDLLTMHMSEFGIRNKLAKNVYTDLEVFYTITENYDALVADSMIIDPTKFEIHDERLYQNLDVKSKQIGVTASIDVVISKKFNFGGFFTWQKTDLENYAPDPDNKRDSTISFEHKWTPSFYGGIKMNYYPTDKLSVFSNLYFYSEQEFLRYKSPVLGEENTATVKAKAILNLKVSYKLWKNNAIFVNIRNLLHDDSHEFAFSDKIGAKYFVGLSLRF